VLLLVLPVGKVGWMGVGIRPEESWLCGLGGGSMLSCFRRGGRVGILNDEGGGRIGRWTGGESRVMSVSMYSSSVSSVQVGMEAKELGEAMELGDEDETDDAGLSGRE